MADLRGGTTISGYLALHTGNFNPTTDNVATATKLKSTRLNYKGVTDDSVVGQLMWKNFGNNHTIIDASAGTAPDGTAINNTNPGSIWIGTHPTLMGWNGTSTYGVRVDIARSAESLVGTPTAPTPAAGTNTTQVATTAFVTANFAPAILPNQVGLRGYNTGGTPYNLVMLASGNDVTIGATALKTTIYCNGEIKVWNGSTTTDVLYVRGTVTAGHFDKTATAPTDVTRLNYNGYLYATRVYNAYYNDYAEYFLRGKDILEPGDVCMIDYDNEGEYIRSNEPLSKLVVGVVSDDYAQCIGGEGVEDDNVKFAPIGMSGRVRVKIIGDIKKGDELVSSDIAGIAMAFTRRNLLRIIKKDVFKYKHLIPKLITLNARGIVIGKALENHTGNNIERIKILIMNA